MSSTLRCEACGAKVTSLRRGRCPICYLRWVETRSVGVGANCAVCGEQRRDNLRLVEFQGCWLPMCHTCSNRAFRLYPVPRTLEGLKEVLARDRRWSERRKGKRDNRITQNERRRGERRLPLRDPEAEWMKADDLIVETIELEAKGEDTQILHDQPK
ncbi:MAG: hypothetical protein V1754_00650 [Pseudomonadota bacterium]